MLHEHFNPSMRQHGFSKVVGCQHIMALVNVLSDVSLDGSGFLVAWAFASMRVTEVDSFDMDSSCFPRKTVR